jgi:hypothetical protein
MITVILEHIIVKTLSGKDKALFFDKITSRMQDGTG